MNQINSIYTTVSKGQVHIAADAKYIGSVDSYNNCFTQFFAWLFGRSVTVNFDGKVRSINRSLSKLDGCEDLTQRRTSREDVFL